MTGSMIHEDLEGRDLVATENEILRNVCIQFDQTDKYDKRSADIKMPTNGIIPFRWRSSIRTRIFELVQEAVEYAERDSAETRDDREDKWLLRKYLPSVISWTRSYCENISWKSVEPRVVASGFRTG
ncbi:hypothetical protein PHYPSEUDO_001919 [Phytophthora pseudosyringae]|uniref:Uncharacterized protein n=1 Tax=Phytophthora pseudosyringae TaxID=221518 RepID=A0A8T1WFN7_9STRA|nr:hypothetical protein PHYPSEUDO_001919 [Phytophthora pseudosyringae]